MDKDLFYDLLHSENILFDTRTEPKFEQLSKSLIKVYPSYTPSFEVNFKKPLGPKRKYYHNLISNETTSKFNSLCDTLDISSTPEHLSYLYATLNSRYTGYLKEIAKFIKENNLSESHYKKPNDKTLADQAYIIHFLKANAIYLFCELQHRYSKYSEYDIYSIDDIFEIYFESSPPEELLITDYSGTIIKPTKKPTTVNNRLQAIKNDLTNRPENPKILSYDDLICENKKDNFAALEERIFDENLIDVNYNFIPIKGRKSLLAAFITQLIHKKYFNEKYFPANKKIEDKHIINFFANRYGQSSYCRKEVKNFLGPQKRKFDKLINQYSWLDKIT